VGQAAAAAALLRCFREEEKGRRVKKKKRRRSGLLGQENGPHRAGPSKEKHAMNFETEKTGCMRKKNSRSEFNFFLSAFYYLAKLLKRK
jgi:hypothetical protein